MPKTVELAVDVPGFTAQALFELVYGDEDVDFLSRFHMELNGDKDPRITRWEGNSRTISFTTPVDAPAFIKRVIGRDVMRVQEGQHRQRLPGGGWQMTSTPVPDMPGGDKFSTQAVLTFRDEPAGGGCQIQAVVTCSASGPYGLSGAIESFMADSARKSLQDFLEFVKSYAATKIAVGLAPAAAAAAAAAQPPAIPAAGPAAARPAAIPVPAALGGGEEQYFDAMELPPPLPLPVVAGPGAVPSGEGLRFEDAALLYLRYMCRTGDQTVGLLQALELHVRSLEQQVAQLQAADERRRRSRRWLPEIPDTVSTRQAVLGALVVATGAAAAALMYGRRQQQQQQLTVGR